MSYFPSASPLRSLPESTSMRISTSAPSSLKKPFSCPTRNGQEVAESLITPTFTGSAELCAGRHVSKRKRKSGKNFPKSFADDITRGLRIEGAKEWQAFLGEESSITITSLFETKKQASTFSAAPSGR